MYGTLSVCQFRLEGLDCSVSCIFQIIKLQPVSPCVEHKLYLPTCLSLSKVIKMCVKAQILGVPSLLGCSHRVGE